MNSNILIKYGINYDKGVKRFMGDNSLYETVVEAFINDTSFEKAKIAYINKDYKKMFRAVHDLKGTSGTLDMTNLYSISCELVELLRNEDYDEKKITQTYPLFEKEFINVIEGIKKARVGE